MYRVIETWKVLPGLIRVLASPRFRVRRAIIHGLSLTRKSRTQMNTLEHLPVYAILLAVGMFAIILTLLEVGRRIGVRRRALDPEGATAGLGAVDGAVFGLMGLLIAFTFSGAASRFDARRELIVQETNAIGTAYLRVDLLPVSAQPKLRQDFRDYLDARLAFYGKLPDLQAAKVEDARATALQREIWAEAVAACKEQNSAAVTSLVLSSLNEMIDITTTRAMAMRTHPPAIIYGMLIVLVMASSLFAGYGMSSGKARSRLHMLGFAVIMAIAVHVILDIEFPRLGFVRISSADQIMVDLRESMK